MINALGIWANWVSLSSQAAMWPLQTQSVIALRLMRMAGASVPSEAEATRMEAEKVQALGEAAQPVERVDSMRNHRHIPKKSMASRTRGIAKKSMARRNRRHIGKKVAGVHKKRVRGNRRRLTR
jgi:hypothetical protein